MLVFCSGRLRWKPTEVAQRLLRLNRLTREFDDQPQRIAPAQPVFENPGRLSHVFDRRVQ